MQEGFYTHGTGAFARCTEVRTCERKGAQLTPAESTQVGRQLQAMQCLQCW